MNLTTKQVAEQLGVSKATISLYARTGQLPTINKSKNGTRVAHLFDSKAITEFKKDYVPRRNGTEDEAPSRRVTIRLPRSSDNPHPPQYVLSAIFKRILAIEAKLDQLIKTLA